MNIEVIGMIKGVSGQVGISKNTDNDSKTLPGSFHNFISESPNLYESLHGYGTGESDESLGSDTGPNGIVPSEVEQESSGKPVTCLQDILVPGTAPTGDDSLPEWDLTLGAGETEEHSTPADGNLSKPLISESVLEFFDITVHAGTSIPKITDRMPNQSAVQDGSTETDQFSSNHPEHTSFSLSDEVVEIEISHKPITQDELTNELTRVESIPRSLVEESFVPQAPKEPLVMTSKVNESGGHPDSAASFMKKSMNGSEGHPESAASFIEQSMKKTVEVGDLLSQERPVDELVGDTSSVLRQSLSQSPQEVEEVRIGPENWANISFREGAESFADPSLEVSRSTRPDQSIHTDTVLEIPMGVGSKLPAQSLTGDNQSQFSPPDQERVAAEPVTGRQEIHTETTSAVEDSSSQPKSGRIDFKETMLNNRGTPAGEDSHKNPGATMNANQAVVSRVNPDSSVKDDIVTWEAIRHLPEPMRPVREQLSPPAIGEKGIPPLKDRSVSLPKTSPQTTEAEEAVERQGHETGNNRPSARMIRESFTAGAIEPAELRSGRALEAPAEKRFIGEHIIEKQSTPQTRSSAERTGTGTYIPVQWNLRQSFVPDLRVTITQTARDQAEAAPVETQQVHGLKTGEKPESAFKPDPAVKPEPAVCTEQLGTSPEPPRTSDNDRVLDPSATPESKAQESLLFTRNRNFAGPNQTADGTAKTAVVTMPGLVKSSTASVGQTDFPVVQVETAGLRNPEFMFRIASRIHTQLMHGDGVVHIQLKPNLLGRLEIHAQTSTSNVSVTIKAESEAVREYLESNLHILQKNLQNQGIKLDRLHFAILDDAGSTSWNYQDSSGSRTYQDNRPPRDGSSWIAGRPEQEEEVLVETATLAVLSPNSTFHTVA